MFYSDGDRLLAVPVNTDAGFSHGNPVELFQLEFERNPNKVADYDVSPDGQRFLMIERPLSDPRPRQLNLILNFDTVLEGR